MCEHCLYSEKEANQNRFFGKKILMQRQVCLLKILRELIQIALLFALYWKFNKICRHKIALHILFFLFCAFVYTAVEWLSYILGFFTYHNGWSIYLSFGFNCIMFPLLLLHYKKPHLAWLASIILAYLMKYFFNLPFFILKK